MGSVYHNVGAGLLALKAWRYGVNSDVRWKVGVFVGRDEPFREPQLAVRSVRLIPRPLAPRKNRRLLYIYIPRDAISVHQPISRTHGCPVSPPSRGDDHD